MNSSFCLSYVVSNRNIVVIVVIFFRFFFRTFSLHFNRSKLPRPKHPHYFLPSFISALDLDLFLIIITFFLNKASTMMFSCTKKTLIITTTCSFWKSFQEIELLHISRSQLTCRCPSSRLAIFTFFFLVSLHDFHTLCVQKREREREKRLCGYVYSPLFAQLRLLVLIRNVFIFVLSLKKPTNRKRRRKKKMQKRHREYLLILSFSRVFFFLEYI